MSSTQVILIAGPSASGKSTLAHALAEELNRADCPSVVVSLDNYYRDLSHVPTDERNKWNFDEPNAWEFERLLNDVQRLKSMESVEIPQYCYKSHTRTKKTATLQPGQITVMEGLFALCNSSLNQLADLKVYVELEDEVARQRRIQRDVLERGRSRESVISQFESTVRKANTRFIRPSRSNADIQLSGRDPLQLQTAEIRAKLGHID